ncbi:hypothetical protein [Microcoleus sp. herbarium12]|uniref:hypothetical protein n=1 Tax=Microcoleus sp. herbarium12 TaxID=3055437 RepID=UPI002FD5C222
MFYKVKVTRCFNTPKVIVVSGKTSQQAIRSAAISLRDEGITDARAIEVIGQVNSLRG